MTTSDRALARARSLNGMSIINFLIAALAAACVLAVIAGALFR